jgi:hypothetical protein
MTKLQKQEVQIVHSKFLIILGAMLVSYSVTAQELNIPNTFTAGFPAVADDVNANFDAVETAVNELGGQTSMADVFTFFLPDETPAAGDIVGQAQLTRTNQGINLTVDTTLLDTGAAYTLWWVIFNNPVACDPAGCSDADFGTAAVEASVMSATGRVADGTGNTTFSAFLPAGFMHTEPVSGYGRQLFGPGLQNAAGAEIHIVIRCHGPWSGNVEQISTFAADCNNAASPSGCYDAQAIVFPLP